ncbi:efflux RND transporter periplasmic adaptor subunit [Nonomuraea sp. NPDC004297]
MTATATVVTTVTTTVTAAPTGGGTGIGGDGNGGGPSATGSPTADADPSGSARPTAAAKPATSAKPSVSGKPTTSARPSQSTCDTKGAAKDGTKGGTGTGTPATGGNPGTGQSAARGGSTEEQAAANVDRAEAALEEAADAVRGTRIVAPAAGTILSVGGRAGDTAGTGTFISLGDLDELQVSALVTESDVNRLELGQQARITLATRNGEQYEGTVTAIAPTATVSGRLVRYPVTLAFDAPPAGLMLGQSASVTVTTDQARDAVYVPATAVRNRSDGTQVVTVRSGGQDVARVVRTGVRGDQYVEVVSGLAETDQVVMSGTTSGEFPDGSWPEA